MVLSEIGTQKSLTPLKEARMRYGDEGFARATQIATEKILARK
jgi:hypothetical protein